MLVCIFVHFGMCILVLLSVYSIEDNQESLSKKLIKGVVWCIRGMGQFPWCSRWKNVLFRRSVYILSIAGPSKSLHRNEKRRAASTDKKCGWSTDEVSLSGWWPLISGGHVRAACVTRVSITYLLNHAHSNFKPRPHSYPTNCQLLPANWQLFE